MASIVAQMLDHSGANITFNVMAPSPSATDNPKLLVDELTPYFKGKRETAERFLLACCSCTGRQVTSLVNEYVKAGLLVQDMCRSDLWRLLHDHGIYPYTIQNWNKQVL